MKKPVRWKSDRLEEKAKPSGSFKEGWNSQCAESNTGYFVTALTVAGRNETKAQAVPGPLRFLF